MRPRSLYRNVRNSFSKTLLVLGLLTAFVPICVTVIFMHKKNHDISDVAIRKYVETSANTLASSIGFALKDGNFELLQFAMKDIKSDPNVSYVMICDESGAKLVEHNPSGIAPVFPSSSEGSTSTSNSIDQTAFAKCNDKLYGKILFRYSTEQKNAELRMALLQSVGFSILMLLLSCLVFVKYLRKSTSLIDTLNQNVNKVASGDLSVHIDTEEENELGQLAVAFNTMVCDMQSLHDASAHEMRRAEDAAAQARESAARTEESSEYLSNSVETLLDVMQRFADGDLSVRVEVQGEDQIARLFQGFNTLIQRFSDVIFEFRNSIEATTSAARQISSSTEEMAAGTQEQTNQTNDVASSVEEMTKTILENSLNTQQTAKVAEEAHEAAKTGGAVIEETVKGMGRIATVVNESVQTVRALGESSAQIGAIISVISEIADQTNLLALNAAIEAARAGEQGRGFSVVADEVRKLAERTTKATKQIEEMIKKIQLDTVGAVSAIEQGTKEVQQGIQLSDRAGRSLSEIVRAVNSVSTMIKQIAVATTEQSHTSEQISRNIEVITTVTSETAHGTQQIASAAEFLNQLTETLHRLVSQFRAGEPTIVRVSGAKNGRHTVSKKPDTGLAQNATKSTVGSLKQH